MNVIQDGPASPVFTPIVLRGNYNFEALGDSGVSRAMIENVAHAHRSKSVGWGIAFDIRKAVVVGGKPVRVKISPTKAAWFVFMHTSDVRPDAVTKDGFISPMRGMGKLNEHAADYVFIYEDGSEEKAAIRRRHEVGTFEFRWGENCTKSVPAQKPRPIGDQVLQPGPLEWEDRRSRNIIDDRGRWKNWLWAFENPHPDRAVKAIRFEPVSGTMVISGLSAGNARSMPLRWQRRQKAVLTLPENTAFDPGLDKMSLLKQIQLDLGQMISATPRLIHPNQRWAKTRQNLQPARAENEVIIEYAAHPDAYFHLADGTRVSASELKKKQSSGNWVLKPIRSATQRVTLRTLEKGTKKSVPVKLHVHGSAGEYLAPLDRQRIPNSNWFEDYSPDLCHGDHTCVYVPGETVIDLPLGRVYFEITKGFEIKPRRLSVKVTRATDEITIELEKVLHWRERGWVTADTHVHFLSPATAMLEGAAEGVNVINLLASQWGELMTNVGDFDGKSTFGSQDAGGDGEYLVRVGSENRQHVLGHISLLGYKGNMITPLCTGGANEAAIGDPVEVLLTEWARQCHEQGGLVVLPHFPDPRLENAATLVLEDADAVEMCSQDDFYGGIDPYSLSDWYRYLNSGYLVGAVGGTDKMSTRWAVGTIRTYARIPDDRAFTYQTWMDAVRRAETFVTYGPLMEFTVEGRSMGQRIKLPKSGGTLDLTWKVASTIVPMTKVELIVNGELRESRTVKADADAGSWSIRVDKSAWVALLVRAKYKDKPEMIAAHSSPVMLDVRGSRIIAAADALTILEQIEGAVAYIDTVGTRAETKRYKEMRLVLESAYRRLHNRMHEAGFDHDHSFLTDHAEHHH